MTLKERREMEQWLSAKEKNTSARLTIDRWHSKEQDCEMFNMTYWFKSDGKEFRINEIGTSLEKVIVKCRIEEQMIQGGIPKKWTKNI